jgi:hypothetical protein
MDGCIALSGQQTAMGGLGVFDLFILIVAAICDIQL